MTDEIRAAMHSMWATVAGAWDTHADFVAEHGRPAGERMLERTAPAPGDRVLELACGPGALGLTAAALVAPSPVVLSDVATEMTEIAARRAAAAGLTNVSVRVLDLEAIDAPDDAFDVVLCQSGLMFCADPARAGAELRRVLAPGGRLAVAVWGPREENPWLGLTLDAVGEQLGAPVPPPGVPGPFSLGDAERLAELVGGAVERVPSPMRVPSVEVYWERVSAIAGPLAMLLAQLPPDALEGILARVREATEPYRDADGALELPGVALVAG